MKLEIRVNHTPSNRYYVTHRCEDCHATVGSNDNYCRQCGADIREIKDGGEEEVLAHLSKS
jgi:predicted amidophosphoribosyltransferase